MHLLHCYIARITRAALAVIVVAVPFDVRRASLLALLISKVYY